MGKGRNTHEIIAHFLFLRGATLRQRQQRVRLQRFVLAGEGPQAVSECLGW